MFVKAAPGGYAVMSLLITTVANPVDLKKILVFIPTTFYVIYKQHIGRYICVCFKCLDEACKDADNSASKYSEGVWTRERHPILRLPGEIWDHSWVLKWKLFATYRQCTSVKHAKCICLIQSSWSKLIPGSPSAAWMNFIPSREG